MKKEQAVTFAGFLSEPCTEIKKEENFPHL
jgi:hypothetical protein